MDAEANERAMSISLTPCGPVARFLTAVIILDSERSCNFGVPAETGRQHFRLTSKFIGAGKPLL
jgi:hypothetical protein